MDFVEDAITALLAIISPGRSSRIQQAAGPVVLCTDQKRLKAALEGAGVRVLHAYAEEVAPGTGAACAKRDVVYSSSACHGSGGRPQAMPNALLFGNNDAGKLVGLSRHSPTNNAPAAELWTATLDNGRGQIVDVRVHFVILYFTHACAVEMDMAGPLPVRCTTPEAVRGKPVIVLGDGCDAWDTACAIALLNEGRGLQLLPSPSASAAAATVAAAPQEVQATTGGAPLGSAPAAAAGDDASAATAATAAAAGPMIPGSALLDEARRRALQAALQPHYTAAAPGPVSRALRAPTKRLFWAYVKGKAERAVRRSESGSAGLGSGAEPPPRPEGAVAAAASAAYSGLGRGPAGAESPVVVWAPSLRDPRVLPFLGRELREALLGGETEVQEAAGGAAERGGGWWEVPSLVLYRGMVHPDSPGLAFVGLEAHPGSSPQLPLLQAQWLTALATQQLQLPPAAAMRADIARHRAWRCAALAHPLMSTHGSLARARERHCLQQLREDLGAAGGRRGEGLSRGSMPRFSLSHPHPHLHPHHRQQQQQRLPQQLHGAVADEGTVETPSWSSDSEHSAHKAVRHERRPRPGPSLLRRPWGAVMAAEGPRRPMSAGGFINPGSSACNRTCSGPFSSTQPGYITTAAAADAAAAAMAVGAAVGSSGGVISRGEEGGDLQGRRSPLPGLRAVRQVRARASL